MRKGITNVAIYDILAFFSSSHNFSPSNTDLGSSKVSRRNASPLVSHLNQFTLHSPRLGKQAVILLMSFLTFIASHSEGVLVAGKDYNAPKHIKAMQSLTSKGCVKTRFSWQYYYYTLTNEGLDYIREWFELSLSEPHLNRLPAEIVLATHKKPARLPRPVVVCQGVDGAYEMGWLSRDRVPGLDGMGERG